VSWVERARLAFDHLVRGVTHANLVRRLVVAECNVGLYRRQMALLEIEKREITEAYAQAQARLDAHRSTAGAVMPVGLPAVLLEDQHSLPLVGLLEVLSEDQHSLPLVGLPAVLLEDQHPVCTDGLLADLAIQNRRRSEPTWLALLPRSRWTALLVSACFWVGLWVWCAN